MIYIILYFLIGVILTIISRLYDKEPYALGLLFAMIIFWPVFVLILMIYCLEHTEI